MEYFNMGIYRLVITFLPSLLILAACIYYVVNKKTIDAILMACGSGLVVLVTAIFISFHRYSIAMLYET